jgi:hypothetical protein
MEHRTLDKIREVAEVRPDVAGGQALTMEQRLDRWAELLARQQGRRLTTLEGTEYQTGEAQALMRADDSAISVAFADPVLRAEGLRNDTYGEARRFFELTDWQLHSIVCHCHMGSTMSADAAAARVRSIAERSRMTSGIAKVWRALTG